MYMQLSYTIKRRDLKPIYRNSGPQLVRKYCEEIEAKTRSAKINIHMEWKPDEVHFDIAGLQEGVTRAMHFIRKEFLPKEVTVLLLHHIYMYLPVLPLLKIHWGKPERAPGLYNGCAVMIYHMTDRWSSCRYILFQLSFEISFPRARVVSEYYRQQLVCLLSAPVA